MLMGDLTLGGGHTVQYIHHVSQKCTLETYIILLTSVASINLIFFKIGREWPKVAVGE